MRDHGGGLDAAIAVYGGTRAGWLDLSTGINPVPYPLGQMPADAWTALPDHTAMERLLTAARRFWGVPDGADIMAAGGASALIAAMPRLAKQTDRRVYIPAPTYNEHKAAFVAAGFDVGEPAGSNEPVQVLVHPNNPTGHVHPTDAATSRGLNIIDESFCDVTPGESHVAQAAKSGVIILKSFGKFWGLAGARLGFAICAPDAAQTLRDTLGPWAVSGPALDIGARALEDRAWADATRARLAADAARLDELTGWPLVGGTDLFRTYHVQNAVKIQQKLAHHHVWSRVFPYSQTWIRLGLPHPARWDQLAAALKDTR